MWQGRELVSVVLAGQLGVRLENCPKPIPWTASAVPDLGEAVEMSFDLAFVPREQDRLDITLDITEVLVQRGAPNAGVGRDLRHAAAISAACKTPSPVPHTAAALLLLLTATVLAVYKPRA